MFYMDFVEATEVSCDGRRRGEESGKMNDGLWVNLSTSRIITVQRVRSFAVNQMTPSLYIYIYIKT